MGGFFSSLYDASVVKGREHREVQNNAGVSSRRFSSGTIGMLSGMAVQRVVHGMIGVPARWRLDS